MLQWIVSVVLTGAVTGTEIEPCCCPLPPNVAFAVIAMVMGISFPVAEPLLTVMPVGAPEIVPTVGVTFFVPVYATTLQVTDVAETWPEALAANVMFSLDKNAMLAL